MLTIKFKNENELIDAIAKNRGYLPTITDANGAAVPNPQTKTDFAKEVFIKFAENEMDAADLMAAHEAIRNAPKKVRDIRG